MLQLPQRLVRNVPFEWERQRLSLPNAAVLRRWSRRIESLPITNTAPDVTKRFERLGAQAMSTDGQKRESIVPVGPMQQSGLNQEATSEQIRIFVQRHQHVRHEL
jgi:hypothetical protein